MKPRTRWERGLQAVQALRPKRIPEYSKKFAARPFDWCFRSISGLCGRDFFGCYLVLEAVRIEAIEAPFGRFRLRIHEESNWCAIRSRQRDIMREVVSHPVHFPRAKEALASFLDHLVVQRTIPRRLFKHDLSHVGRINGNPTVVRKVDLGAA